CFYHSTSIGNRAGRPALPKPSGGRTALVGTQGNKDFGDRLDSEIRFYSQGFPCLTNIGSQLLPGLLPPQDEHKGGDFASGEEEIPRTSLDRKLQGAERCPGHPGKLQCLPQQGEGQGRGLEP